MIGTPKVGTLDSAIISGVCHEGLTITLADGRHARLAVIDDDGNIIEAGPQVAQECWNVTLAVYRNFMIGKGYLRVHTSPPGSTPFNVVGLPAPSSDRPERRPRQRKAA